MKKKQVENSSRVGASAVSVTMYAPKIADTPTRTVMVSLCPRRSVWGKHSAWKSTPEIGAASSHKIGQKPGGNAAPTYLFFAKRKGTPKETKKYIPISFKKEVTYWAEHKQKRLHFG